jgi:hypothetical protein
MEGGDCLTSEALFLELLEVGALDRELLPLGGVLAET